MPKNTGLVHVRVPPQNSVCLTVGGGDSSATHGRIHRDRWRRGQDSSRQRTARAKARRLEMLRKDAQASTDPPTQKGSHSWRGAAPASSIATWSYSHPPILPHPPGHCPTIPSGSLAHWLAVSCTHTPLLPSDSTLTCRPHHVTLSSLAQVQNSPSLHQIF